MTNENLSRGLRITSVPRYMKVTQKRDPSYGVVGHIVVTYKIFHLRVDLPRSGHSNARRLNKPVVSWGVVMLFHISHASHLRLCLRDAITTDLLDLIATAMTVEAIKYSLNFSMLVAALTGSHNCRSTFVLTSRHIWRLNTSQYSYSESQDQSEWYECIVPNCSFYHGTFRNVA